MTYNNWKRGPYSKSDPTQAIMSRYDLRRPGEPYGAAKAFGGLDSKCCKVSEFNSKLLFHAIASPAKDNTPPWVFGVQPYEDVLFDDLPQVWNFNWTTFDSISFAQASTSFAQASISFAQASISFGSFVFQIQFSGLKFFLLFLQFCFIRFNL
ncbi:hypothetical protein M9Y10_041742 [Tritrichomonas musculus]|uniref:Phospholipase B-like n=1 Tax=Tritrichomonas musculus TaxID=1915356 RepID=A0ABR2K677_9EUKA